MWAVSGTYGWCPGAWDRARAPEGHVAWVVSPHSTWVGVGCLGRRVSQDCPWGPSPRAGETPPSVPGGGGSWRCRRSSEAADERQVGRTVCPPVSPRLQGGAPKHPALARGCLPVDVPLCPTLRRFWGPVSVSATCPAPAPPAQALRVPRPRVSHIRPLSSFPGPVPGPPASSLPGDPGVSGSALSLRGRSLSTLLRARAQPKLL